MNSEEAAAVAMDPFVRAFTFAVIQSVRSRKICPEDRQCIHADLIPKVSEKVMRASMEVPMPTVPKPVPVFVAPVRKVRKVSPPPQPVPVRVVRQQQIITPATTTKTSQDYGKIMPLLNDPSVSTIECPGAGKPILIIRAGQRQITKITLNPQEIKDILQKISGTAHIPILEGVFRAVVDGFSVNAVISEMIGSKFILKKQTPYALLERQS
jgi:hypothetical protein